MAHPNHEALFRAIQEEAKNRQKRFREAGLPKIHIGLATCGIASGALETKKAFEGQKFKWKKVIYKEHNGFFIFFSGIFLLMFYKGQINLLPLVFIITGLAFLNGMVKYMKWKHPENET